MDVSAILIDPDTKLVSFGFPPTGPVKLTGIHALAQLSAFTILRSFGGDYFRGDYGTKFLKLPGTATINDFDGLRADITLIVKNAERIIITEQESREISNPDELLSSLIVRSIEQDHVDPTIIHIIVDVINVSGETFEFKIPNSGGG